jgi:uncharacterized membrane protein YebE (DUF533 family)
MFNPEKLLGGLLMGGSRRRGGLGGLISSSAALGLAGVAIEAAEHLMSKSKTAASGLPPLTPSSSQRSLPPQPPQVTGVATPPSAPPGRTVSAPPPPPPSASGGRYGVAGDDGDQEAILLIRAMIAAANADSVIDEDEHSKILKELEALELSEQEHSFISEELLSPTGLEDIVARVKSHETAKMVYTVSLLAIDVDTDAERAYMKSLAQVLNLNESDLDDIYRTLKIEKP